MSTHHTESRGIRRGLGRVARTLVTLAAVIVVLGGIAWALPSALGYERYVITGGSMSGSIEKGAVVFTRNVPEADLAVGDVITYLPPSDSGVTTLVTHRIHDIKTGADGRPSYRTQGDANPDPDPWRFALDSEVQPVVQFHVPLAGHVLIALADRDIRMLVIGIPAGLVALGALTELVSVLRGTQRRHRLDASPTTTAAGA